jgi:hypothetical protein
VEVTPWNLVQYSEDFANAVWTKVRTTIASNDIAAPNGTTTADKLSANATLTSSFFYIGQDSINAIVGQSYTATLYAKAGTLTQMMMYLGASNGIYWNLSNGQFISYYSGVQNITSYNSESVGNGWYKYTISINATITTIPIESYSAKSGDLVGNYTTADNYYIWGAQLNIGATAKPYFPTTDRLNVPRLTYQNGGGGCPSLLLEKQSTNLMTYSEQFDNAVWDKSGSTISANATTSPDGTQNADKFIPNNGNQVSWVLQDFVPSAGVYTYSMYVKSSDFSFVQITGSIAFAMEYQNYNIANGTLASYSGAQGSIQSMGNGWYRLIYTLTASATGSARFIVSAQDSGTAGRLDACTGNGTKFISIWGAQLEVSSYPTSLINTTSASATRVADECSKTGISSLIGQTEGVLFADVNWIVKPESGSPVVSILTINNNVANLDNCIILGIERQTGGSNRVYCLVQNSGSTVAGLFGSNITNGRYKIALAYKANDFVLYVNGVQIATDTSGSVPTTSEVLLGQRFTGDSYNLNDSINESVIFKTRLTNAELASLTTI